MDANRHQIQLTAEQDAESDASKILWFVVGFALSVLGLLVAYIYQQAPPISRLYEKSQEYTMFYTDAYKAKSRAIQVKYALVGFLITVVLLILYIAFIITLHSNISRRMQG